MDHFTLHELRCFDAVVTEGSFQAAAAKLHRTHPTVFAAVGNLERELGLCLLDRAGYRVELTEMGRSFHRRARAFLQELDGLCIHAAQLAMGEESELRVVIGDLCPLPETLGLLRRFFDACPGTRLHLHFEALSGPWERLFDNEADLILHHINKSDQRLEYVDLYTVRLIPVVAPGFLPFPVGDSITPGQMRNHVQCIIRDSARHSEPRDYFVIEGAHSWTVADQLMKKEVILRSMGWGHMPTFLIEQELREGRLVSVAGRHFPGGATEIVAARRRDIPHGPIANRLWRYIEEQGSELRAAAEPIQSRRSRSSKQRLVAAAARKRRPAPQRSRR
jgi:DNA-binding transcriptional LysR family regulator